MRMHGGLKATWRALAGCLALLSLTVAAHAGNIGLAIDSSPAGYVREASCSGEPVDEERRRRTACF